MRLKGSSRCRQLRIQHQSLSTPRLELPQGRRLTKPSKGWARLPGPPVWRHAAARAARPVRPRLPVSGTRPAADPLGLGPSLPPAASKGQRSGVPCPGAPRERRALTSRTPPALEPPLMAG
ncbi:hypothetical protein NDU88_001328 [Pleurodeles waltl]|uniref:Uncharacterized protein n=1 Tax=Pleurodeles waltl TaxID=8319 RepID=A0AAV7SYY2_PLEWA|nr:hypothetical protein NDU88_001328 [Pleurodeles waltl]